VADSIFHHFTDDFGIFSGTVCLYEINQKRAESANEHVSQQDGVKLCEFSRSKITYRANKRLPKNNCMIIKSFMIIAILRIISVFNRRKKTV
jgi:hypothetical protein